jgi:hypothetical protein
MFSSNYINFKSNYRSSLWTLDIKIFVSDFIETNSLVSMLANIYIYIYIVNCKSDIIFRD